MYAHHIDAMADAVASALKLDGVDQAEAREAIAGYWRDRIALVWDVSDVIHECTGLSREQARDVLTEVHARHDANLGVAWDTLADAGSHLFGPASQLGADQLRSRLYSALGQGNDGLASTVADAIGLEEPAASYAVRIIDGGRLDDLDYDDLIDFYRDHVLEE